jgi:uncharacterized phiE125 gp8 family phage protein
MGRVTQQTLSKLSVPAEAYALDLEEVRTHRRLGSSTKMTGLLKLWTRAATQLFESETGRAVLRSAYEYRVDCFPPQRYLELPKAPLLAVASVCYASDGSPDMATLDPSLYDVITPAGPHCTPGRIQLRAGAVWPTPLEQDGAVVVTFSAGYGTTEKDVPDLVKAALLFLVGHFHRYGEEVVGGPEAANLATLSLGASTMMREFKYAALQTQRPWEVPWLA